jgi:hypothetical protein
MQVHACAYHLCRCKILRVRGMPSPDWPLSSCMHRIRHAIFILRPLPRLDASVGALVLCVVSAVRQLGVLYKW